jgi:uncharacterized protein (TIGR03437 family)
MANERFLNSPRQINHLLSRRGMLRVGLLPLLALRGSASERIQDGGPRSALALPLEGGETGFHGTAVSPDGSTAYVAFSTPDIVLVVDLRAGQLRSAIDLTPAGVMVGSAQAVLSADGKLLFVANQGIGNIAVIDTAAERVIKVLPFCPGLGDSIKASPAGKVYIGLQDGRLVTVSCDDLSYKTMSFGVFLDSIALSAARANLLYAVSYDPIPNGQSFFHAFNLDTGREERRAVLPKEACRPSGGVKRLQSAPSGDVAYLGWHESDSGSITALDLTTFRAGASTAIEDGVMDFALHPENGKVYAVGDLFGVRPGRVDGMGYITEWDPASQQITRRLPISPSKAISAIVFDPLNPRFVYATEVFLGIVRKVDLLSGTEYMRVRFFSGKRMPYAATTSGSLAYITGYRSPLIHKLDLNSGKLAGTLDLPGLAGSGQCAYYDGKLYVGDYSHFSVINTADGSLILSRDVPGGLFLTQMTFFRDKIAAGAGPLGGVPDRMVILDARTLDVLSTFKLELPLVNRWGCAVASPDGSKLYVQQGIFGQKTILQVLDSATLRVLKRIEPPTTVSQGGDGDVGDFDEQKRIAYLGGFSSVYKVHMDTDEFLGTLNINDVYKEMGRAGGWPVSALRGIHLSPAKDRLVITSWDGQCVYQYDLRNEKWIPRVVPVGLGPAAAVISPDRKNLYTVSYRSDTITHLDTTTGEVVDVIPLTGPVSELGSDNLVHGASYQRVGVVPGCVMAIFDKGALPGVIGPPFLTMLRLDASGRVATELAGTQVLFDGVPAPLLYAYAGQVAVVAPFSVAGKSKVKMQLIYNGEENYPVEFNVADAGPGIFTTDSSGQGQAAMLNEDYSLNGPANPAAKGSIVMFYATGGGQTEPPGVDGEITKDVLARPRLPVGVWVHGQGAEVLYAGAAPGCVSGVMQVNIRLPMNIPSGDRLAVGMRVGGWWSLDGVTLAVR